MKLKVLIIEDNDQNLYLTTFILEKHGYQVYSARNGFEGIEKASAILPDLILLDIQLPGLDGYSVAKRMRENPVLADTPIVALTSYAMTGDREKTIEAGCTAYMEKPINPETFMTEIESYLGKPE